MALVGDKFTFIHNPHTGGSSLRAQLKGIELGHPHMRACDLPTMPNNPSFAIVRHPFEWFVSRFEYIRRHPEHYDFEHCQSIDDYIAHYEAHMIIESFLPNSDYYCTQSDYVIGCKHIIRFESPMKYAAIFLITGVEIDPDFVVNNSESKTGLTEDQKLRLRELFKKDFQLYGY